MPLIEIIDGIRIKIYNRDHLPAHIHAMYNEYEAVIAIDDGRVLAGDLPFSQMRKLQSWLSDHREELRNMFHELNSRTK